MVVGVTVKFRTSKEGEYHLERQCKLLGFGMVECWCGAVFREALNLGIKCARCGATVDKIEEVGGHYSTNP